MNPLAIANISIRQDDAGRYCLNDLHKASGGANRHRPSLWMANKQTKALIDVLNSEQEFLLRNRRSEQEFLLAPIAVEATRNPATYVVRELVYAYAMWISPAFHIQVIRTYDALMRGDLDAVDRRLHKMERAYFTKHPKDEVIRMLAIKGEPYWYIGMMVQRTAATVGRAVKRMIEWSLIEEQQLLIARRGMHAWWVRRRQQVQQHVFSF